MIRSLRTLLLGGLLACAPRHSQQPAISPADLFVPLPAARVTVDGIGLNTLDSGGSGPVVVFIHGLSSSMGFWERQIPAFVQQGYRVLALDLPGFGDSDRPDAPYTPPWFATLVTHWLDGLGVSRASFVGHSMGGQVALTLALASPDRVDRLVLCAPAGIERFSRGEARWMKNFYTESRALEADEDTIRANYHNTFNRWDEGVERLVEERVRLASTAAFRGTSVAVARSVAGMLDFPVADRLGEIGAPTLIVFGTEDRLIPNPIFHGGRTAGVAKAGQRAIPNSQLLLIPSAGHTVHHDAPEAFNAAVLSFLAPHP